MIELRKLNNERRLLNHNQIECFELIPESKIVMMNHDYYIVRDTVEEIIEKIGPGEATDEEKMKYGAIYLTELVKNRGERDNITVAMVRTI